MYTTRKTLRASYNYYYFFYTFVFQKEMVLNEQILICGRIKWLKDLPVYLNLYFLKKSQLEWNDIYLEKVANVLVES